MLYSFRYSLSNPRSPGYCRGAAFVPHIAINIATNQYKMASIDLRGQPKIFSSKCQFPQSDNCKLSRALQVWGNLIHRIKKIYRLPVSYAPLQMPKLKFRNMMGSII